MSDSVQPHSWQPTRLPCPWDSQGKNTGVGCHFLLQCMKVKSESEVAQSCPTLSDPIDCIPTRLLHPWDFPDKSTGVGCHWENAQSGLTGGLWLPKNEDIECVSLWEEGRAGQVNSQNRELPVQTICSFNISS